MHEPDPAMPLGALAGIRVADFSRVLAGPYATMMLADFGADVIKVEPPAGDDTRHWKPPVDAAGEATYFGSVNRNKRSVVLDLTNDRDLAEARRLAASADVVIENFRPGVMDRFGLSYEDVRAANPGVVYCSITGFGAGAGAGLAGYDLLVQAVGGLMSITGEPEGEPAKAGVALVDVLCGQNAVAGILLALRERDRAGLGQRVEANLLQSLLSALTNQAASTLATGHAPRRLGNQHPSIAPYAVFPAADRDLVIAVGNDRQFRALTWALGIPALADDPRYSTNEARVQHRDLLRAELEAALAGRRAGHWVAALGDAGVPAGLVNDVAEAIAFADGLGLEPVVELGGSRTIADPIRLSSAPPAYRTPPPRLDEHAGADWLPRDLRDAPEKGPRA
ncbi:crotonobetainyl-CoA:carnitine CoA-transferase CaiB-like acyl-CoA transferase [Agromyces sp. 3263]|uniref:CaiB/BaiF CoA transferase family protein n=1 Tax=Agromyces sp. 3263 TaxID=2817750 RepID=UPI00285CFD0C|nr:CoA transferase [Agromyces sp. 3263]MDR6905288.1 crotonobetainyl-CoA:carnitine CoA-transferase CaiB-like acyl-CoA transferase [Agromyces sp. 3263]